MPPPPIAIFKPTSNEAGTIPSLLHELTAVLDGLPDYAFTVLFVDDGSSDDTATLLEKVAAADPRIGVDERSLPLDGPPPARILNMRSLL